MSTAAATTATAPPPATTDPAWAIPDARFPATLNLRNGNAKTIKPATRFGAIPAEYRWVLSGDVVGQEAAKQLVLDIHEAFGMLGAARTRIIDTTSTAAATAGSTVGFAAATASGVAITTGTDTDWAATVAAANTDTILRSDSIVLGAARATIKATYLVADGDIRRTEAVAIGDSPFDRNATSSSPTIVLHAAETDLAGTITFKAALAKGMTPLTPVEMDFAWCITKLAMGAVPFAGCEIMETGHHFLSSNVAAVTALEKQVFSSASAAAAATWNARRDAYRDILWHKSIHPISSSLLSSVAIDKQVKDRLNAAGLGAAAVRLPYVESAIRGARAMMAVVNAIKSTCDEAGYEYNVSKLEDALAYVVGFSGSSEAPNGTTYSDKLDAINDYLRPTMEAAGPYIAWAAGMFAAIVEDAGLGSRNTSQLRSTAVTRAVASNVGANGSGRMAYDSYKRWVRKTIADGELPTVIQWFSDAPKPAPPAPADDTKGTGKAAATKNP